MTRVNVKRKSFINNKNNKNRKKSVQGVKLEGYTKIRQIQPLIVVWKISLPQRLKYSPMKQMTH